MPAIPTALDATGETTRRPSRAAQAVTAAPPPLVPEMTYQP
ncbi:hypothetical protein [Streptomyces pharetrae]